MHRGRGREKTENVLKFENRLLCIWIVTNFHPPLLTSLSRLAVTSDYLLTPGFLNVLFPFFQQASNENEFVFQFISEILPTAMKRNDSLLLVIFCYSCRFPKITANSDCILTMVVAWIHTALGLLA